MRKLSMIAFFVVLLAASNAFATIFELGFDTTGYVDMQGAGGEFSAGQTVQLQSQIFIDTSLISLDGFTGEGYIMGNFITSGYLQIEDISLNVTPLNSHIEIIPKTGTVNTVNETYIGYNLTENGSDIGILQWYGCNGTFVFGDYPEFWWQSQEDPFSDYLFNLVGSSSFTFPHFHSNEYGRIVGNSGGYCKVVPVPEPATILLFSIGSLFMGIKRKLRFLV